MKLPKFLKPFVTKEALVGWALALHQKVWWLIQVGGDVDFIATYSPKLVKFFQAYAGTWVVILLGVALIIHSYYRSVRATKDVRRAPRGVGVERSVRPEEEVTQIPQQPVKFCPEGLYVGNIDIDHRFIDEKRVLTIMVSGFNASGCSIDIREVRGSIKAKVKNLVYTPCATFDDVMNFGLMTPPSISTWVSDLVHIENFQEFFFELVQNVPEGMLDEVKITDSGRQVELDFGELDVMVYPTDSNRKCCRLPLWSGTNFHLSSAEWVKVHKVVSVSPQPAGAQ